jgi:hypothetical protein
VKIRIRSLLGNHLSGFVCSVFVISIDVTMHGRPELVMSPIEWVQCILGMHLVENTLAKEHFLSLLLQALRRPCQHSIEIVQLDTISRDSPLASK